MPPHKVTTLLLTSVESTQITEIAWPTVQNPRHLWKKREVAGIDCRIGPPRSLRNAPISDEYTLIISLLRSCNSIGTSSPTSKIAPQQSIPENPHNPFMVRAINRWDHHRVTTAATRDIPPSGSNEFESYKALFLAIPLRSWLQ